jgi:hypothetical protein
MAERRTSRGQQRQSNGLDKPLLLRFLLFFLLVFRSQRRGQGEAVRLIWIDPPSGESPKGQSEGKIAIVAAKLRGRLSP